MRRGRTESVDERERFLATLEAAHVFPGPYTFKVIGDNERRLLEDALAVLRSALPGEEPAVSRRESERGNHQSITFEVRVPDAVTVHDIYVELKQLDGTRVLL